MTDEELEAYCQKVKRDWVCHGNSPYLADILAQHRLPGGPLSNGRRCALMSQEPISIDGATKIVMRLYVGTIIKSTEDALVLDGDRIVPARFVCAWFEGDAMDGSGDAADGSGPGLQSFIQRAKNSGYVED